MSNAIAIGIGTGFQGSNSFSPSSISNLVMWVKADSLSLNNGNSVTTWSDSSGNGYNMTFNTNTTNAGGTAIYNTNVLNGKPVIRLTAGGNFTNSFGSTITQPITIFSVSTAKIVTDLYLFDGISPANRITSYVSTGIHLFATLDISSIVDGSNSFADYCFVANGASSAIYKDGTSIATGNIGSNSLTGITLNNRNEKVGTTNNNEFAEFIVYNKALSDPERVLVQTYLSSKYGI